MPFAIELNMTYEIGPSRMVMLAIEAARSPGQTVLEEHLSIDDASVERIPGESGVGTRLWAHLSSHELRLRYRAEVEVTETGAALERLSAQPVHTLPAEAFTYLRPSRFCQSDEFVGFAANRFGTLEGGAKIAAIRDWVAHEVRYLPATSDTQTTVLDTFARREGVCRDFAHLVCALSRASGIPARYASVYGLGVNPQDFHAVAEVWLDGDWHLVDATKMCSTAEMVMIGVGRDAFDAPFMETEDEANLLAQTVVVSRTTRNSARG
ncbi:transglutaminase family protein [Lutimaribacter marinistellae]|uniref:Transglutaminase family protein n=1 Tax=Lutimaribacter marinistellae TaxID=1820329 RepID=A0ABV7TGQ0_9RHOB